MSRLRKAFRGDNRLWGRTKSEWELCLAGLLLVLAGCGDDDDDSPTAGDGSGGTMATGGTGSGGSGGMDATGGTGSGGTDATGGTGSGGTGSGGMGAGVEVELEGCCMPEGVCGYYSTLRNMCITESPSLDPPISAGDACDPPADLDAGTDDDGGAGDDSDCPSYTGIYTP